MILLTNKISAAAKKAVLYSFDMYLEPSFDRQVGNKEEAEPSVIIFSRPWKKRTRAHTQWTIENQSVRTWERSFSPSLHPRDLIDPRYQGRRLKTAARYIQIRRQRPPRKPYYNTVSTTPAPKPRRRGNALIIPRASPGARTRGNGSIDLRRRLWLMGCILRELSLV